MKFDKPENAEHRDSVYLSLKDGQAVTFIPRGEVYSFYSIFGIKGPVTPLHPDARKRYKLNVIVNENGQLKAKILEFGKSISDQFYELSQICNLSETKLRFSRKGSGKSDTVYVLLPVMNEPPLSKEVLAKIADIDLNILDKEAKRLPPSSEEPWPNEEDRPAEETWSGF